MTRELRYTVLTFAVLNIVRVYTHIAHVTCNVHTTGMQFPSHNSRYSIRRTVHNYCLLVNVLRSRGGPDVYWPSSPIKQYRGWKKKCPKSARRM